MQLQDFGLLTAVFRKGGIVAVGGNDGKFVKKYDIGVGPAAIFFDKY